MSKRLETLRDLVDTKKVFDVGCDHGLLAIMLASNHDVVASDISVSSVNKTRENIKKANLNIEVYQSDGLEKLDINKDDSIVIAGMGTYTILKILKNSIGKIPNTLIIQTNNNYDILRREVVKLGYYIDTEKTLYLNKWYVIIRFKKGVRKYSYMDYLLGINPSKEYLEFNLKIYEKVLKKIPYRYFMKRIKTKYIINKIKENYFK